MDIESKFTPQSAMYPTTPNSMDMILNVIQMEHSTLGINMNEIIIIIKAPTTITWIEVGLTNAN